MGGQMCLQYNMGLVTLRLSPLYTFRAHKYLRSNYHYTGFCRRM